MPAYQINAQDKAHLNLLSVFHYVLGALHLLGIGFLVMHFMFMSMVMNMVQPPSAAPHGSVSVEEASIEFGAPDTAEAGTIDTPPMPAQHATPTTPAVPVHPGLPKKMMSVFIFFYLVMGVLILTAAIFNVFSGIWIKKRKNRTFSFVIAGLNCLQFPFGTALGVFTFIVLSRVSVKMAYDMAERNQQPMGMSKEAEGNPNPVPFGSQITDIEPSPWN